MEIVTVSIFFKTLASTMAAAGELEGCNSLESCESDLVLQNVGPGVKLSCVIQHPRI